MSRQADMSTHNTLSIPTPESTEHEESRIRDSCGAIIDVSSLNDQPGAHRTTPTVRRSKRQSNQTHRRPDPDSVDLMLPAVTESQNTEPDSDRPPGNPGNPEHAALAHAVLCRAGSASASSSSSALQRVSFKEGKAGQVHFFLVFITSRYVRPFSLLCCCWIFWTETTSYFRTGSVFPHLTSGFNFKCRPLPWRIPPSSMFHVIDPLPPVVAPTFALFSGRRKWNIWVIGELK